MFAKNFVRYHRIKVRSITMIFVFIKIEISTNTFSFIHEKEEYNNTIVSRDSEHQFVCSSLEGKIMLYRFSSMSYNTNLCLTNLTISLRIQESDTDMFGFDDTQSILKKGNIKFSVFAL